MKHYLKRTWAIVHLDRLDDNLEALRRHLAGANTVPPHIMAVIKANAYGHGDHMIARELANQGVDFFAVSNLEEALSLRRGGIGEEILILGFTPPEQVNVLAQENIIQAVYSPDYAAMLESECTRYGVRIRAHIKLDTGMGRIGFDAADAESVARHLQSILQLPHLEFCGIFTHLSSADMPDPESRQYTRLQMDRYGRAVALLEDNGVRFACRHLHNSAGIAFYPHIAPEQPCDYTRAGILLYGEAPSSAPLPFAVRPVMELKTVVSMVKELPADRAVSYGRTFVSTHPMRVATVPIGYADGYPRLLSNRGAMLIHGRRAPIIGNICMDQLMLDVSDIPEVAIGDVVTVVGREGREEIGFHDLAAQIGTIGYELMCLVSRRVPRIYLRNGQPVEEIREAGL